MAELADPMDVARDLFPDMPPGFPYENFELEELILPSGDDMGIRSDEDDVKEEDVQTESGFGSVVVLTGLPIVPEEKYETLLQKGVKNISKKFAGAEPRENGMFMPQDETTKMTKGFAFVEFNRREDVEMLMRGEPGSKDGYALDKNHRVFAYRFDDFERYARVPDQYVPYEPPAYKPQENLLNWLGDKFGRDQYVMRHGDNTAICWNDGKRTRADLAHQREFWTESFVQFSPQGTYLATVHRQGVATWGGPTFQRILRFAHQNVRLIDFSPNERFLVSYTAHEPAGPRDSFQVLINIWDVDTGRLLRPFQGVADEFTINNSAGPLSALKWPVFKWSGGRDDQFFARLQKGKIMVYQTGGDESARMKLVGGESIKADSVRDIEWSPTDPYLAAYLAEQGNQPAKITVIQLPEKAELRSKGMQLDVSDVKMLWHPQGDYLAARVESLTKSKKSTTTMFHIFSMRDKDTPLETIELPNPKDKVITFAWEPRGHRLAIVHGEGNRPNISIYSVRDEKSGKLQVKCTGNITNRICTNLYWSPHGRFLVLAGLKTGANGQLEFFSVDDMETLGNAEHFMATDVEWDPTGRYVASMVTSSTQMENGVNVYSFNGKHLYSLQRDKLFQFSWRPRPASLVPEERDKEIQKNLKQYSKRYDEEDEQLIMQADADVLQERQKYLDEWQAYVERRRGYAQLLADFKRELIGPQRYAEGESTIQKVLVEQVIEVKEEPYATAAAK